LTPASLVPASGDPASMDAWAADLVERARAEGVALTGDGRRAALDLRLVGEDAPTDSGKLTVAAQRIAAIHHATRDHRYTDETNQLTLRPGALQLVFCDVSTPAADGWNAYDELRALLPPGRRCGVGHYLRGSQSIAGGEISGLSRAL